MAPQKAIPFGSYCYSTAPAPKSGFTSMEALKKHIESLPFDEQFPAHLKNTRRVRCPYWQYAGKGRVRCNLLQRAAVLVSRRSERLAEKFYKRHPEARERDKGFLLGDAVKECSINH